MRYFIKIDGKKVIEWQKGYFTDDGAQELIKAGFIEVEDGELLDGDTSLMYENGALAINDAEVKKQEQRQELRKEMDALTINLINTDYVVVKIAEGVATKKDYADVLKDRAEWRKRINEIQAELNAE